MACTDSYAFGETGVEPATSRAQGERSSRLSYTPIVIDNLSKLRRQEGPRPSVSRLGRVERPTQEFPPGKSTKCL